MGQNTSTGIIGIGGTLAGAPDGDSHLAAARLPARGRPSATFAMSVCSAKTRTAALSVRTRWRPGPWHGSSRRVRLISANRRLMVVPCIIVISRNCRIRVRH